MKNIAIFIDTNIIIDFLAKREPFTQNAQKILDLCNEGIVKGCISSQSIVDAFYVLRKDCSEEKLRSFFIGISTVIDFIGADKTTTLNALKNSDFADFEDCVQSECAAQFNADYIITRNTKDFALSKIPALTPEEFFKKIEEK